MEVLGLLLIWIVGIFTLSYVYYKRRFNYWQKLSVPTLPTNFLTGNFDNPLFSSASQGEQYKKLYNAFKERNLRYGGIYIFGQPVFMPIDVDLIKCVLTKDYTYFNSRGIYHSKEEIISENLFCLEEDKWKTLRGKLSPTFTSGKMKMMYNTVLKTTEPLLQMMKTLTDINEPVDIKQICSYFTTDVTGSCSFGIDCNSFNDPHTDFIKYSHRALQQTPFDAFRSLFEFSYPDISKKLGFTLFPKEVDQFFRKSIPEIVRHRESNNITRNDFIQILIDLKNNKNPQNDKLLEQYDNNFDMDAIIAQAFVFFLGGYETSSSTMTFCLFELSRNLKIQDRVRSEINQVWAKHGGCTYEALGDLVYLKQVIEETLRKYPVAPFLMRQCTKDYHVPDSDLVIKKGTNVHISNWGIHMDPEHYPNPSKFDPDRFSEENKKMRNPYTFLSFGEGPRICIGLRFGIMQTKVGLVHLLRNYSFSLSKQTKTPLEFDFGLSLNPKYDVLLDVQKI